MTAPSGVVAFLFTDIQGSTALWDTAPESMRQALVEHDRVIRAVTAAHEGHVFATMGDGFGIAFHRTTDAISSAVSLQEELQATRWPADAIIRVRMGAHVGEAHERDGDYFGPAVNLTARIMGSGHPDNSWPAVQSATSSASSISPRPTSVITDWRGWRARNGSSRSTRRRPQCSPRFEPAEHRDRHGWRPPISSSATCRLHSCGNASPTPLPVRARSSFSARPPEVARRR